MPKFTVCYSREVTQTVCYTVEAEDEDAAEEAAHVIMDGEELDGGRHGVNWETQDNGFSRVRCDSIDPAIEDEATEESFERDDYLYVPEVRETVGDAPGWIWTRWTKQKGTGQALSGRAFLPSGTGQHGVVSRFEALDRDAEGNE